MYVSREVYRWISVWWLTNIRVWTSRQMAQSLKGAQCRPLWRSSTILITSLQHPTTIQQRKRALGSKVVKLANVCTLQERLSCYPGSGHVAFVQNHHCSLISLFPTPHLLYMLRCPQFSIINSFRQSWSIISVT